MRGIATDHVVKSFRGNAVLDGLSFCASEGRVTLLAGLNGAGKTTWIRTALGLVSADSGDVTFNGAPVRRVRPSVSVVLDEPPVYPWMSGRENLRALSGDPDVPRKLRDSLLDALALTPSFLDLKGGEYSLGQRRRLAVAMALMRRPKYLFLDEPTVGLDPVAWRVVRGWIRLLADDGCAVVVTGQGFDDLAPIVDGICVLHAGQAVFDGSTADFVRARRPRVWVETTEVTASHLAGWLRIGDNGKGRFERECLDLEHAHALCRQVRSWDIRLEGVGVCEDTLEEAFLAAIGRVDVARGQ